MSFSVFIVPSALATSGLLYAGAGAFTGLVAGLLGIGGGVILVPVLVFIFLHSPLIPDDLAMHLAAGTALTSMVVTSLSSILAHRKRTRLVWPIYIRMVPGIVAGLILGALLADALPTEVLRIIFGLFLLLIVAKMLRPTKIHKRRRFPSRKLNHTVCFFIGLKSGLLGVGGGAVIIPYLTYCGVKVRKIVGISSMCSFTVAVVGCIVYSLTGYNETADLSYCLGYVYWPAALLVAIPSLFFTQLGAGLAYALPIKQLKLSFMFFLLITAIHLLI